MSNPDSSPILNDETYNRAITVLASQHPDLADALSRWGKPPFWTHPRGFRGVVIAILAQQVSLESAQAAFSKLESAIGPVEPESFLSLDDRALKAVGFSRQKTSYVRGVAHGITAGRIDLQALDSMPDDEARNALLQVRGIGVWTADTYLLFALRRADAWPSGDLALAKAIQEVRGLATTPGREEVDGIADCWKPWRAVAARILWHHYLSQRGRFASA